MADKAPSDPRELYEEITALMGGIAKAFELNEDEASSAVEQGEIALTFDTDANGNRFVLARYGERAARLYAGAIKQEAAGGH
jgi:hypothetical protein